MIQIIVLGTLAWLLLRGDKLPIDTPPEPEPTPTPTPEPEPVETWQQGYSNESPSIVVWLYTNSRNTSYWLIGNYAHTSFIRESADSAGTIDISSAETGGTARMSNVRVFSGQDTAADELDNLWFIDPNNPENQEPEEDGFGSIHGGGLGQGRGSL